jgi:hypothetical protein
METINQIRFTFEMVKNFNHKTIESTLETHERLYLFDHGRIAELKSDVARYILAILDDADNTSFIWYSKQINKRLDELCQMGCQPAVERFFKFGYWT